MNKHLILILAMCLSSILCGSTFAQSYQDISLKQVEDEYRRIKANMNPYLPQRLRFKQAATTRCDFPDSDASKIGPYYCGLDNTIVMEDKFFEENGIATLAGIRTEAILLFAEAAHRKRIGRRKFLNLTSNREFRASENLYHCIAGAYTKQFNDRKLRRANLNYVFDRKWGLQNRNRVRIETNFREGFRLGHIDKCFGLAKFAFIL